jgi:hypothetical protein
MRTKQISSLLLGFVISNLAIAQQATEIANTLVQVSNGELSKLGANKRVALTACIVEYQTSVKVEDRGSMFNRNTTTAVNSLVAVPKATLQDVANSACTGLRDKLSKAGFTVLPDAEVRANPAYQQLLSYAGAEPTFGVKKIDGGALVFADASIPFYLPYMGEGPTISSGFVAPEGANYEKALPDAKSGPDGVGLSRKYDIPNLEIALAKSLNAHVVKAWTLVGFGSASASSERDWSAFRTSVNHAGDKTSHTSTNYKSEGEALLSIAEHQTRLSVRIADGKAMGYAGMMSRGPKIAPTDGDVVMKLAAPVLGGNSFFSVDKGDKPEETGAMGVVKGLGSLFGGKPTGLGRGGAGFYFETKITNPDLYRDTAVVAIGAAHDGLVGLMAKP